MYDKFAYTKLLTDPISQASPLRKLRGFAQVLLPLRAVSYFHHTQRHDFGCFPRLEPSNYSHASL